MSALGFGLGDFLAAQRLSGVGSPRQKARSCILIWLDGGPSHLDTFDPKPDAPREIRGPFGSIATKLPGVRISEHLPRTAKILDKVAMLRAVTSPFGVHNFAAQYLMTGHEPTPSVDYPTFGSTLAHVREQAGVLPPNV
ncbi:MAG: DUF1501 domain-containing protein, partial [Planctomycetota bacterium]